MLKSKRAIVGSEFDPDAVPCYSLSNFVMLLRSDCQLKYGENKGQDRCVVSNLHRALYNTSCQTYLTLIFT